MRIFSHLGGLARKWKKHDEARALPLPSIGAALDVFYANPSVVAVHNLRHDRQSQAHSALLRAYEGIEDLFSQLRRNSRPGIGDTHLRSEEHTSELQSQSNLV